MEESETIRIKLDELIKQSDISNINCVIKLKCREHS